MKKTNYKFHLLIPIIFCLLGFSFYLFPQKQMYLKLPVRVISKKLNNYSVQYINHLQKDDFTLHINNFKKKIIDFYIKKKSIISTTSKRQFIISVDASIYTPQLSQGISYFVNQILKPSDQLILGTPLHQYKINANYSKSEIINFINTSLKKDIQYKEIDQDQSIKELTQLIKNFDNKLTKKKIGIRSISLFVGHLAKQWQTYSKTYLISNLEKYSEITSLLAQEEGNKWMIHFQERNLAPLLTDIQNISKKIKQSISSFPQQYAKNAQILKDTLIKIEKSMCFEENFSIEDLLNLFLGININYNVIFFSTPVESNPPKQAIPLSGYEKILKQIAQHTGGTWQFAHKNTLDFSNYLKIISEHEDLFYELAFDVGHQLEDKNLKIHIKSPQTEIFYKKIFKKKELQWLIQWVNQDLSISDILLKGHQLSFEIKGFKLKNGVNENNQQGFIHINIQLINEKNEVIYNTEKKLKTKEPLIKISLDIPSQFKGFFKLSINAHDMIANKKTQSNKYVKM